MTSVDDSGNQKYADVFLFLELPDQPTRDAFVAEALRAMQRVLTDPRVLATSERATLDMLKAHAVATSDLVARMREARGRGDTHAEDRLFRALVIAAWRSDVLIGALLGTAGAEMSNVSLDDRTLELVAQTGHSRAIRLISFSPDGSRLMTAADDGRAISWTSAGEELSTFWCEHPICIALSPDGRRMVFADSDHVVHILDSLARVIAWERPTAVRFAAFSSDGAQLVTSGAETIVWSVKAQKIEQVCSFGRRADASAAVVAFSSDGDLVLTEGPGNDAILWDARTGAQRRTLTGHAAPLRAAAFSADGTRAATLDAAGVVIVWDTRATSKLLDLKLTEGSSSIALSPDGRLLLTVSVGAGARLLELDAAAPGPRSVVATALARIKEAICAAALSPAASSPLLVVGTADGALRAFDCVTGHEEWTILGMQLAPKRIDFADDGRQFTVVREDGTAHEWDAESGELLAIRAATAPAMSLSFEPLFPREETEAPLGPDFHGQVIRDAKSGDEIGYLGGYALENGWFIVEGARVIHGERRAPSGLWLLLQEGGAVCVLDEKARSGGWLFRPAVLWEVTIDHCTAAALSPDGRFVLCGVADGTVELWKVGERKRLGTLLSLPSPPEARWVVADDEGRYDASQNGLAKGLHWLLDLEPIELSQLKLRYYDPRLLAKKMQLLPDPLRTVTRLAPKLFPRVTTKVTRDEAGAPQLQVSMVDRGGGVGTIRIKINGKEAAVGKPRLIRDDELRLELNWQDKRIVAGSACDGAVGGLRLTFTLPLAGHPLLHAGDAENQVTVVAMDEEDVVASRGYAARFASAGTPGTGQPKLWGIVAGVSRYQGPALNLSYAGKDARDFGDALKLAAGLVFGDRVDVTVLSTEDHDTTRWPTRGKLESAFERARAATSGDVLVVYLAGHGVLYDRGSHDDFYYLTPDAVEGAIADPVVWEYSTLSGEHLTELMKKVPALKQVVLLDTCHAGRFIRDLREKRQPPSSALRAIERMKDRIGTWVLAAAAADRVSYEATRYAQGLFTYALLDGMCRKALRNHHYIDIGGLCQYVVEQVPELAKGLGGVQQPLLSLPEGMSFDIGAVNDDLVARIRLAGELPVVERGSFQEEEEMDDPLELGAKIDETLRDRAARSATFVFVDGTGLPGALRLAGRYHACESGSIVVVVRLFLKRVRVLDTVVEGPVHSLAALIVEKVAESLAAMRSPVERSSKGGCHASLPSNR